MVHAIENQVQKLLPEEISKSARNRGVGEIYRELDATLRSNRQLAQQMRDASRSGSLDADRQRAIVSLVAGPARYSADGDGKSDRAVRPTGIDQGTTAQDPTVCIGGSSICEIGTSALNC